MRSPSDSNESGLDVVHDYVGSLPDDATAGGLGIDCVGSGGWGENA